MFFGMTEMTQSIVQISGGYTAGSRADLETALNLKLKLSLSCFLKMRRRP